MMLLIGAEWEQKYEANKELPNPDLPETEDEKFLFKFLRDIIPSDSGRFRRWCQDLIGVSEETTTGVMRLY